MIVLACVDGGIVCGPIALAVLTLGLLGFKFGKKKEKGCEPCNQSHKEGHDDH